MAEVNLAPEMDELTGEDRDNALFGDGLEPQEAAAEVVEEVAEEVSAKPDGDADVDEPAELTDEEMDEEVDRAETMYNRMREKVVEAQTVQPEVQPDGGSDSAYQKLAEKAIDALAASKQPVEQPQKEEDSDWSQDPAVINALRESYPSLDDEEFSRAVKNHKILTEHSAQKVALDRIAPLEKRLKSFEETTTQRQSMAALQGKFQSTLEAASKKSALHAFIGNHYNQDMAGSLLGNKLAGIGRENPQALMGVLQSPQTLVSIIDGLAFEMESQYGDLNVEDSVDEQVESSTAAQTRSPRRQQKRTKQPSQAETDEQERRETFGEKRTTDSWEVMQPMRGV